MVKAALLPLLIILIGWLGACGTPSPMSHETTDTLIMAGDFGSLRTLDPAAAYEIDSFQVLGNLYETLVSYEPETLELTGVLAKDWTITEQGDTWQITFTLDEQATFASGNPVTANDVVFSWRRAIERNEQPAFLFTEIAQLDPQRLRAVDAQTVEVILPDTTNPQIFLSLLSFSAAAILDQQELAAQAPASDDATWLNEHSVGSGPYRLERWQQDERLVLTANPRYWRDPPAFQHVIMRDIADPVDLQALIASGEIDIAQDLTTTQAEALTNNPDVRIVSADTLDLVYIGMNITDTLPLAQPAVREALRYAINYEDLHMLLGDTATVMQEIIPAGIPGHTGQQPFEYDPAHARSLLEQGEIAEEDIELELLTPPGLAPGGITWRTLAAKLQSDMEQVGVHIRVRQSDQLLDIYRAQQHELAMTVWSPDFVDPDANVTPFVDAEARSIAWRNQWNAPELAALARQAAQTTERDARLDLYRTISSRVQHEGPYVVLYQPARLFGVRRDIRGFVYSTADTPMIRFSRLERE
jgi:peptide/nickel transport system substrate-binding protein